MAGKIWVGVTDDRWYKFLSSRPHLDEVNFWQPSGGRSFRILAPNDIFLFKLHSPNDFIVGGGFFAAFSLLPSSLTWETFGEKNGAATYEEMRNRIEKYRKIKPQPHEDYQVGCIILRQPFFFPRDSWIPVPPDWKSNIVQGKHYPQDSDAGKALFNEVSARIRAPEYGEMARNGMRMFGDPTQIVPRLGQGTFRVLVTDIYQRHCAVTGEKTLPVLDAAHIKPVAQGGLHRVDNGLLFRTDIHRLFDKGYVTVTPDHRFQVSRKLREDFDNGKVYYDLQGRKVWVPPDPSRQPRGDLLAWHADEVYLG